MEWRHRSVQPLRTVLTAPEALVKSTGFLLEQPCSNRARTHTHTLVTQSLVTLVTHTSHTVTSYTCHTGTSYTCPTVTIVTLLTHTSHTVTSTHLTADKGGEKALASCLLGRFHLKLGQRCYKTQ